MSKLLNERCSEDDHSNLSDDNSNIENNNETTKTFEHKDTVEVDLDFENLPESKDEDWLKRYTGDDVNSDSSSEDDNNLPEEKREQLAKVRSYNYIIFLRNV